MTAEQAAAALAEIAYLLRHRPEDAHRARAYSRAAGTLLREQPDLARLRAEGRLTDLEGVGAGIARTLRELVEEGRSSQLVRLREQTPMGHEPVSTLDLAGYRGDLHVHSTWSDGHAPIVEMARAARARGHEYLAICDHSPRIKIVNGLDGDRLARQAEEIAEAAGLVPGLTILRGIEVDILEDASLDLPDEILAELDVVVASPHVKLRMERVAMIERMLRAVESPHVDVIGHPTGRRLGGRDPADYDYEAVFRRAAELGTALEIDCDPARMDLSPELARLAASLGCRLSLDSDAHDIGELAYVPLGKWMAERAGIEAGGLLNWMPLDRLREWLRG
ncbi:MAG: PHP domain-containing protein [Candidatus Dormibacteraceae bacterium]